MSVPHPSLVQIPLNPRNNPTGRSSIHKGAEALKVKPRARGRLAHEWHLCDLSSDPSLTKAHSLSPKHPTYPLSRGQKLF